MKVPIAARARIDVAFDRRRRRGKYHRQTTEPRAHHCHVASLIVDAIFLLEPLVVLFVDDDEAEIDKRQAVIEQAVATGSGYKEAYQEAAKFEPAVAKFFTDVFVMAEDPALRQARLRLMKRLERLILQLGDISEIVAAE